MKAVIWTVVSDTDFGTECYVFLTERAALNDMFERAVEPEASAEEIDALRAEFEDDPYGVLERYKRDLDTWSHESHEISIPLLKMIRDTMHSMRNAFRIAFRRRARA